MACSECLKFLFGLNILNKPINCLNTKVGIARTADQTIEGTLERYKQKKIFPIKIEIAKTNAALMRQSIIKLNKNIKPDVPIKMNKGNEAVTKPKNNLFQLNMKRPLSIKPVEFGIF